MARRYRFNAGGMRMGLSHFFRYNPVAPFVAGLGIVGVLAGGLSSLIYFVEFHETEDQRITREAVEAFSVASTLPELDTYKITDDAVIRVTNDEMQTSYNFRENYVAIDGPDDADRALLFSEYPVETIQGIKQETCEIYSSLFSALEDFQTANGFQHPQFEDLTVSSVPFTNAYCP